MKTRFWKLFTSCLSDILLLGFATCVLFLFTVMGLSPDRCVFVGEPNIIIWIVEVVAWVACIAWSINRLYLKLKEQMNKRGNRQNERRKEQA